MSFKELDKLTELSYERLIQLKNLMGNVAIGFEVFGGAVTIGLMMFFFTTGTLTVALTAFCLSIFAICLIFTVVFMELCCLIISEINTRKHLKETAK